MQHASTPMGRAGIGNQALAEWLRTAPKTPSLLCKTRREQNAEIHGWPHYTRGAIRTTNDVGNRRENNA